jgi:signal transduction histidine kinase
VQVNDAYARAGGNTPEFFKGRNHFDVYPHDENRAIFEQVVRTGAPYRAHAKPFAYSDDPQRVSYWDWQLTPLRNEQGQVQYLVLNLQDVTQQQRAMDELEHRAFQLQKLTLELSQAEDRERRRMAEVLHDGLQQQLAAAKFHLGLLSSRAKSDTTMQEIAVQLDSMLRDAIEQSRTLSHELSPAVLYQSDLGETFEWLARQVQTKHGLTVHTEVHGLVDSESESIKAFLYRTGQEILFNTVKHAKVQEVRLRLQRKRDRLWLTIADQGDGFDPGALGLSAGFGLLSIRERVGLLGGRMRIRSAPGKGSTFLIAVPDAQTTKDRGQRTENRGRKAERTGRSRSPSSAGRSAVLRVLLVDDHKVMREGLAALIGEQEDMEVVGQAGDGGEAVERARELEPDVIIMDVAMPVIPGDEATRRIKAQRPEVRIIALSMFTESGVREKMLDAGVEDYLAKTGPSEGLLAAIRGEEP